MSTTTLPADAIVVILIAAIVQVVKPLLELWLPATAPAHDAVIRLLAVLLGVGLLLLRDGVPATGAGLVTLLGYGLGTALAAIGGYHLLTGSANPPPIPLSQLPQDRARMGQDAAKPGRGL